MVTIFRYQGIIKILKVSVKKATKSYKIKVYPIYFYIIFIYKEKNSSFISSLLLNSTWLSIWSRVSF